MRRGELNGKDRSDAAKRKAERHRTAKRGVMLRPYKAWRGGEEGRRRGAAIKWERSVAAKKGERQQREERASIKTGPAAIGIETSGITKTQRGPATKRGERRRRGSSEEKRRARRDERRGATRERLRCQRKWSRPPSRAGKEWKSRAKPMRRALVGLQCLFLFFF